MNSPDSTVKPLILLAPLDWGLGHATRCIPIIYTLLKKGCRVLLAGEGNVKHLLAREFPQLPFVPLKNYAIRYGASRLGTSFSLTLQIPKILSIIQYENTLLRKLVREHGIDGVISDNRYGLYHPQIPTVFITHQLLIKTPWGAFTDHWLQRLNYRYINRYSECWVPDSEANGLGGALSHPQKLPAVPVHYLGVLSRFGRVSSAAEKHLLILLSGPEPQRSLLENRVLEELESFNGPVILVRGLPGRENPIAPSGQVQVFDHLPAGELEPLMRDASFIISRCGYSTIMDIARLRKRSVLIPTPGQTEQEYLGRHLSASRFALVIPQQQFRLITALELAKQYEYQLPAEPEDALDNIVENWLTRLTY